ncbi:hypothetical protein K474DRAFT_1705527 [Panus rudis PR-1116 ss-1]|nr:hypothetical protein K474DRAFT_1705527 [Panus rudis PR-1116 ss-1]
MLQNESHTSSSSAQTNDAAAPSTSARKRLLPEQIAALQALFDEKTHPSKEERGAIASELGLELKSVNVWYQNRRRSAKKQALAWKPLDGLQKIHRRANPMKRPGSLLSRSSSFSLDRIAASRERNDIASSSSQLTRPPLSPKKSRNQLDSSNDDLWEHIPSSPRHPPSSPTMETERLSALPPNSKLLRSLEWACAKDRVERRRSGAAEESPVRSHRKVPDSSSKSCVPAPHLSFDEVMTAMDEMVHDDGHDTDTDTDEIITPNASLLVADFTTPSRYYNTLKGEESGGVLEELKSPCLPAEHEAAMALLGFKP